jgi:hypothetical protein
MADFDYKLAYDKWDTRLQSAHQTRENSYSGLTDVKALTANREFFKITGQVDLSAMSTEDAAQVHSARDYEERQIQASQAYVSLKFEKGELARAHTNPMPAWTDAAVMGMNRWNASVIRSAATGTATAQYEGETSSSAKSLSGDQVIAAGGTSLTEAKVKSIRSQFVKNKALMAGQKIYCAISQEEEDTLTAVDHFINSDYNSSSAVESGVIAGRLYGVTFVRDQDLANAASVRTCFAWVKSGILFGEQAGVFTRQSEIQDRHYMDEFYLRVDNGATRTRETDVMSVLVAST